ncbi:MAG: (Fe-S)-binding protein [Anaerolineales bacterium]|nr:MAG: (Fe-S)-binding protein [Anaerolineales bacterium]
MSAIEPRLVDDALWYRLLELTDGAAALCYQCGVCTAMCPWGDLRKEPLSVRTFLRQAQLGLQDGDQSLWLCTTCAQCSAACPRGVDIVKVLRALRLLAWELRQVEIGLPSVLWSLHWNNNPWTQPPSQRAGWAKGLDIPAFDPQQHEILFYVGCTSSFDRRSQKIARALVHLLDAAGVRYGYLGEAEPCCGESALSLGHSPYFREVARQAAQTFDEHGVTALVAISPHCYDVFKNHFSASMNNFEPMHYTQYLAQLLESGRLRFNQSEETRVTFQDPCYLGRHNGEYQAPRRILASIPGLELVEMTQHEEDGLCCGGGGGRMWLETPAGERFSDLRVEQAAACGASLLATACPFCVTCLEDSAKFKKLSGMQVLDIAELAARTVSNGKH